MTKICLETVRIMDAADLVGMVFDEVERREGARHGDLLIFHVAGVQRWVSFSHTQQCCETMVLEDVVGDLDDLIGTPILFSDMATSTDNPPHDHTECFKWTFYRLRTVKGDVTLRFLSESNGYYSDRVDICELEPYTREDWF